ncbi:unnamed protein product [Ranitomeya imitator]|uniref:Uncharacterized protein n=1 Tax=Ranitomeya imitator TaxID=111125 RepID=A0ABN9KXA1_9NEOB|nr:unnamed protein product [Ranitomeya imitator]
MFNLTEGEDSDASADWVQGSCVTTTAQESRDCECQHSWDNASTGGDQTMLTLTQQRETVPRRLMNRIIHNKQDLNGRDTVTEFNGPRIIHHNTKNHVSEVDAPSHMNEREISPYCERNQMYHTKDHFNA